MLQNSLKTQVPEHLKNNNTCSRDIFDDQCMVCGYDDYEEENKIIYCEICDIAVHQNCIGEINKNMQYFDFICLACKAFGTREKSMSVKCQICSKNRCSLEDYQQQYEDVKTNKLKTNSHVDCFHELCVDCCARNTKLLSDNICLFQRQNQERLILKNDFNSNQGPLSDLSE